MGQQLQLAAGTLTVGCPDGTVGTVFLCCGTVEAGADTVSGTISGGGLPAPLTNNAQPNPFTGQWQFELGPVPLPPSGQTTCDLAIDSWSGGPSGTRLDHKPSTVTVVSAGAPDCACASPGFVACLGIALGRCFRHVARFAGFYGGRPRRAPPG